MGFASYLANHPNACLRTATYFRNVASQPGPGTSDDGTWALRFSDGRDVWSGQSARSSVVGGNLGPLALSQPLPPTNRGGTATEMGVPCTKDARADAGTVAALFALTPLRPTQVRQITYEAQGAAGPNGTGDAGLSATDAPIAATTNPTVDPTASGNGSIVGVDLTTGALTFEADTRTDTSHALLSPLPPGQGMTDDQVATKSSLIELMPIGNGLAVGATLLGVSVVALAARFLLFPLYTRLRRSAILGNPQRAHLFDLARATPGIHQAQLVAASWVGRAPTLRHLDRLVHHGFLTALRQDGFVRYYATGEVPADMARREALLLSGSHRAVFDLFEREPDLSLRRAAARLGMRASSVYKAKRHLIQAGLLPSPLVLPVARHAPGRSSSGTAESGRRTASLDSDPKRTQ
ncbi:MAG: hypothetical protein ACYDDF_04630 [Thermoplasmatota archaeon]